MNRIIFSIVCLSALLIHADTDYRRNRISRGDDDNEEEVDGGRYKRRTYRRRFASQDDEEENRVLVKFKVNSSKVPDKAAWAEKKVRKPLEKWAGNVVELLDGKGAAWKNGVVEIVLEKGEGKDDPPAWAGGGKIYLNMKWALSCQHEVVGACVHEFAHVVQDYTPRPGRASPYSGPPGWLVEGIADWVRWFNFEGKAGIQRATGDARNDPRHDGAYGLTASFLDFIAKKYDRDFVSKLNKICRQGKYKENVWERLTGKTREVLAYEWQKRLGVKSGSRNRR